MSLNKTGIFAVMLAILACAGGAVLMNGSDDVDAVGETYEIQYVVADTTYSFTGTSATVVLKSIEELGLDLPEGKQMDGWQYHGTAITVGAGSTVTLSSDAATVFDAIISDVEYTVQFVDGETVISTGTYGYGDAIVASADPTKSGYTFGGWSPTVSETVTADATYSATWDEIFAVEWVVEGVTVATGTTESTGTLSVPADPVKDAFRFLGWTDADGATYTAAYEFTGNTVFSAGFAAEVYKVTFVYGAEETVLLTETVAHGDKAIRPASVPAGYAGWDWDFSTAIVADTTITATESAAPAPAFWSTAFGQCAIIIGLFIAGLLVWAVIPKIGGVVRK